ncbi:hypothetical protein P7F88_01955 [Vibrio hannami]|uniref:hypothetical protein n=1 Tax=Vibrio hannami TaxID=2717094 RepID=UPI0024107A6F|nr:hypothetical protein [Vibrio hannami]MDG3084919.1 hypothetical protein [Vibrio hannami]
MKLVAKRDDGWQLYKAAEQYFESQIELTDEQLATDGEEQLMSSGNLKQLAFSDSSIKGWFNNEVKDEDFQKVLETLEPIIVGFWQQKKIESWIMEIY